MLRPPSNRATSRCSSPEKAKPVHIRVWTSRPSLTASSTTTLGSRRCLKDFYQTNPGDNIEPSKPTDVFIGYDSRFFYIGVHAFDDPAKVRASVARRDGVFGEDNVRIFLDTFNDQRKAYVLGWNPLGVQQDGIMTEGGGTDYSVDIVMESKGEITTDAGRSKFRYLSSRCVTKPAKTSYGASPLEKH